MSEMAAIVREFVLETNENLDRLEQDIVELEKNPTSRPTLTRIFRTLHSIKGATGFLGFTRLGAIAHAGEGVLSRLRDSVLVINPEITDSLLSLADTIRQTVSKINETGQEGADDYAALIVRLNQLKEGTVPK